MLAIPGLGKDAATYCRAWLRTWLCVQLCPEPRSCGAGAQLLPWLYSYVKPEMHTHFPFFLTLEGRSHFSCDISVIVIIGISNVESDCPGQRCVAALCSSTGFRGAGVPHIYRKANPFLSV